MSYQDDERVIMKGYVQWNTHLVEQSASSRNHTQNH